MNENKQSMLGLEESEANTNIIASPFLISLPDEQQAPTNAPQTISSTSPVLPPTMDSGEVIAPPPPPLLAADNSLTPPYLLQQDNSEPNVAPMPATPQIPTKQSANSSSKVTAEPIIKFQTESNTGTKVRAFKNQEQNLPKPLTAKETVQQSIASSLQQKENSIAMAASQLESLKTKNQSKQTLMALQPAFANIEKVLKFQAENNIKRDYDEQHYTVAQTQSLFNLTANQISGMPYWRGK